VVSLTLECIVFLVPIIAGYTEQLETSKGYRNVLDNFVLRSKSQRCNYELHFMLDGGTPTLWAPFRLWLDKNFKLVDWP
jgi:hypothetical protein